MSKQELSFEYYMANATVDRKDGQAQITMGDNNMTTHDDPDLNDSDLKEESWPIFSLMNNPDITGQMEKMIKEDEKEYFDELIKSYDEHSFIKVKLEYDNDEAKKLYNLAVAEGCDQTFEVWIEDKEFQALEFEVSTRA